MYPTSQRSAQPRAALSLFVVFASSIHAQFGGPSKVVVAPPETRQVAPIVQLSGTALPYQRSLVAAAEEGIVVERLVSFGSSVEVGDVLVRLESSRAQAAWEVARADLAEARARLAELEAGERPPAIAAARAELARASVSLADARRDQGRFQALLADDATTLDELDEANRGFEVAEADHAVAAARLKLLEEGPRKETLDAQRARWTAAKARLAIATRSLADQEVRAPFTGRIAETRVEIGNWVAKGGQVAELVDAAFLDVVVLVPQKRFGDVVLGRDASCSFPTSEGPLVLSGKIVALGAQTAMRGRTVPVTVRVGNESHGLVPGMSATVELPVGVEAPRLLVHKDAVLRGGGAPPRLFVVEEGKAALRTPEFGRSVGHFIEVLGGLAPDAQVVIRGNERLQPGAAVLVVAANSTQIGRGA